jgi:hypothetical protein
MAIPSNQEGNRVLLGQYLDRVQRMGATLDLLAKDGILAKRGYKIHYAIDFAEIYSFSYRQDFNQILDPYPNEAQAERDIRGRMALGYIFSNTFDQLVLLPPYIAEFTDHLKRLRANLAERTVRGEEELKRKGGTLLPSDIQEILGRVTNPTETLAYEEAERISHFAADHYGDLYAWLQVNESIEAIQRMQDLVKSKKIIPMSEHFEGIHIDDEDVFKKGNALYNTVSQRASLKRDTNSYMDALACAYVESLNAHLKRKKEYLVLISHTKSVSQDFGQSETVIEGIKIRYVRDLDYFLTYLIYRSPEDEGHIVNLIGEVKQLHNRMISKEEIDAVKEASEWVSELKKKIEQKRNLEFTLAQPALEAKELKSARLLIDILNNNKSIIENMRKRTISILHDINDRSRRLYLLASFMNDEVRRVIQRHSEISAQYQYVQLSYIPSEPPLHLNASYPMVRKLTNLQQQQVWDDVALKKAFVSLATEAGEDTETYLLLAYIACLDSDWDRACTNLDQGLHLANLRPEERRDLLLFKCHILRRTVSCKDAFKECYKGWSEWDDDPGFNRLMAVIIWQALRNADDLSYVNVILQNDQKYMNIMLRNSTSIDINLAIKHALRAEQCKGMDNTLKGQIFNTLAYLYTDESIKQGLPSYLELARAYISKLRAVISEEDWIGRFYHTRGLVSLVMAGAEQQDAAKKEQLLLEAIRDFKKTKEDQHLEFEVRIVQEHLEEAESKLNSLRKTLEKP